MASIAPQPTDDNTKTRTIKSETLCDLERAEQTLSGMVSPDAAQKIVHDYREKQANGAGEEYDEKLAKLQRRIKKGSRLKINLKRRKKLI